MYKQVLAFGDSHVAGCELADPDAVNKWATQDRRFDDAGKLLAFPQLVADRLGIPCVNVAMSGGSNHRSLRLLTHMITEWPQSLVLFGYTHVDRSERYWPQGGVGVDDTGFLQLGTQWCGVERWVRPQLRYTLRDLQELNHDYIKNLVVYDDLPELTVLVSSVCQAHAAGYLHLPLCTGTAIDHAHTVDFGGETNWHDWAVRRGFRQTQNQHFELAAHTAVSELIVSQLGKAQV